MSVDKGHHVIRYTDLNGNVGSTDVTNDNICYDQGINTGIGNTILKANSPSKFIDCDVSCSNPIMTTKEGEESKIDGVKYDEGKNRLDLIDPEVIEAIGKVLTFGVNKYPEDNNWRKLEKLQDRYYGAALRHLIAWRKGEILDKESGLPHLAHALTCIHFILADSISKEKNV